MKRLPLIIGMIIVMLFAFTTLSLAQTINACYDKKGGLRIVNNSGDCKNNETFIFWNQVGPQGPAGDSGPIKYTYDLQYYNISNPDCDCTYYSYSSLDPYVDPPYTPKTVLEFTPENTGKAMISAQIEYNFLASKKSGVLIGLYISHGPNPQSPTCDSDFTAYTFVGFGGPFSSTSNFAGQIPVYVQYVFDVMGGTTYHVWSGVKPFIFDCPGNYLSWKGNYIVTLHSSSGL